MTADPRSMSAPKATPAAAFRAARFELGRVVSTPGAARLLISIHGDQSGTIAARLLARHASGDWGRLDPDDIAANEAAVLDGSRILSSYPIGPGLDGSKLWIITEADRSSTTILRPDEY